MCSANGKITPAQSVAQQPTGYSGYSQERQNLVVYREQR